MKKVLAMMMVVMMVAAMFVACGEKEPAVNNDGGEVKSEVFAVEEVSVMVPAGWKAYSITDVFSDNGAQDTNTIQMAQGTGDTFDPFTESYLQIDYYGADTTMMKPDSSWYDEVEEIAAFELDNYTWNGFKAKSMGTAVAVFWAEDGDEQVQVMVWPETGKKIDLEGAEFKSILGSIAPVAADAEATAEAAQ